MPRDVKLASDTGLRIRFHEKELIEDSVKSTNIELKSICGKCIVFKAHENESMIEILQRNNKSNLMAYVCRYKLVKETIYKLVPVGWQPGEEEAARNSGEMTDTDFYTDTEDQTSEVATLSEKLDQLHTSLTMDCDELNGNSNEKSSITPKLVSPFKIVNNSVHKITRSQNQTSPSNKRTSPDAGKDNEDVSPSKRNKLIDDSNNETPGAQKGKYESPVQKQMLKIKKNLNASFIDLEIQSSPYESTVNPDKPLKITLSKANKRILGEKNENTMESPLNKTIHTSARENHARRSIMKAPNSAKSVYKLSFTIYSCSYFQHV